jgi:hypothetical protein
VTKLGIDGLYRVALFFRLSLLPLYIIPLIINIVISTLDVENVRFSETLTSTNQSTQFLNPKEYDSLQSNV